MSTTHRTLHTTTIDAPAATVYEIIADVTRWPQFFAPNIHVEHLEQSPGMERLQIWASANGEIKQWTSRRELRPDDLTVTFRQEVSVDPVASMGGRWAVTPVTGGRSVLALHHDFTVADDVTDGESWIREALDRNSDAELAGVKRIAEEHDHLDDLLFDFEDTVHVAANGNDVFDFLHRADQWPARLPHVARLDLSEDGDVQLMAMDTRASDGSTHTTESVRIVFGTDRIVYKQTTVPALLTAHTGQWTVAPADHGVNVSSQHTVILRPDAVERILGRGKTLADARAYVHDALSTNSRATLGHAKAYAEALRLA